MAGLALALALGLMARAAPEPAAPSANSPAPGATPPAKVPPALAAAPPPAETATAVAPSPAQPAAPKPRPRLSPQLAAQVSTQLPVWSAQAAKQADQTPPPPAPPADSDVVQMPRVVVYADRLPRIDPKEWLTSKAWDGVLVKQYLSDADRNVLNRYTLPLVGTSPEERARMMYEEDKRLQDLRWINDQIDQLSRLDPTAAKDLSQVRNQIFTRTDQ